MVPIYPDEMKRKGFTGTLLRHVNSLTEELCHAKGRTEVGHRYGLNRGSCRVKLTSDILW